MTEANEMTAFVDAVLSRMTLREKIGQLNYPGGAGTDTTGVAKSVDAETLIRRGEVCGVSSGSSLWDRHDLQKIAVEEGPNGIPLFFGKDCIQRYKTGGPIPLALSCSWDLDLIRRISEMTAREARADGVNINWAPMLDISYDARWGRVAEGNGEFPFLGARIAETIVTAYQGSDGDMARPDRLIATLKHFAGYGLAQAGRDYAGAEASVSTLFRVMEPFRAGIAAGAGAVMVSFNTINDVPATANIPLLQDVLRGRFGFKGIVVTDYTAIDPELVNHGVAANAREAAYLAFKAGVTIDLVSEAFLKHLGGLVEEGIADPEKFHQPGTALRFGPLTEAEITDRCRDVLDAKYRLGLFTDPYLGLDPALRDRVTYTREHVALVREAATKSCILLKNERNALPLAADGRTIALIGPLAHDRINMQGTWAMEVEPDHSVTLLEGVRAVAGNRATILHAKGCNIVDDPNVALRLNVHNMDNPSVTIGTDGVDDMIVEALATAGRADTIILCLGEANEHSGESATRADIGLPTGQRPLFDAIASHAAEQKKPLVLIAMAGRPLALSHEVSRVDALIWTGQLGNEAGNAVGDLLFGNVNPSGRLSIALPRSTGQLPLRTEDLPTGRPQTGIGVSIAEDTEHDRHGVNVFRKFTTATILEEPHTPLFPAGFGLSYTSFGYGAASVDKTALLGAQDVLQITVPVTNAGARAGAEIVQLYLRDPVATISRPLRELKGFQRLDLAPGEMREVRFMVTVGDLSFWQGPTLSDCSFDWEAGDFDVMVGPNADEVQTIRVRWQR